METSRRFVIQISSLPNLRTETAIQLTIPPNAGSTIDVEIVIPTDRLLGSLEQIVSSANPSTNAQKVLSASSSGTVSPGRQVSSPVGQPLSSPRTLARQSVGTPNQRVTIQKMQSSPPQSLSPTLKPAPITVPQSAASTQNNNDLYLTGTPAGDYEFFRRPASQMQTMQQMGTPPMSSPEMRQSMANHYMKQLQQSAMMPPSQQQSEEDARKALADIAGMGSFRTTPPITQQQSDDFLNSLWNSSNANQAKRPASPIQSVQQPAQQSPPMSSPEMRRQLAEYYMSRPPAMMLPSQQQSDADMRKFLMDMEGSGFISPPKQQQIQAMPQTMQQKSSLELMREQTARAQQTVQAQPQAQNVPMTFTEVLQSPQMLSPEFVRRYTAPEDMQGRMSCFFENMGYMQ